MIDTFKGILIVLELRESAESVPGVWFSRVDKKSFCQKSELRGLDSRPTILH